MVYAFKTPTSEQIGKSLVADHLKKVAALAEPFPSTVTLEHFVKRDLGAAIEAGRCTVTYPHPVFSSMPGLTVVDIRQEMSNYFVVVTVGGREWVSRSARTTVAVTWIDFGDTWAKLSLPMRRALHILATDSPSLLAERGSGGEVAKPRPNTLRALESRHLLIDGQLTPSALALYCQNRKEFFGVG
jgi:hypothetical protein